MSSEPMDWIEFMSARQLLAEERLGVPYREGQRRELAEIEQTKELIRRHERIQPPPPMAPRLETAPEPLVLHKGETKRGRVA